MFDAIVISDLHLGSDNCQAKLLSQFLEQIADQTHCLILNGDVFDSIDFRRLTKHHWKVLSSLRRLAKHQKVIWICGNHDGPAPIISHLLGVPVVDQYILHSGDQRILFLHGHTFDNFLDQHPILVWFSDLIYWFLQKIDHTHYLAKIAKKESKIFLRCARKIEKGARALAQKLDCTMVCCGHIHHAETSTLEGISYFNSGCWTELPCHYLQIQNGQIDLLTFLPS